MNYKAILDKLTELEARVALLEQNQRKQTVFPSPPQPHWQDMPNLQPPWQITCKTNTE